MSKEVGFGQSSSDPALSVVTDDNAAAIRIRHGGTSGNAIEIKGAGGATLWSVGRDGSMAGSYFAPAPSGDTTGATDTPKLQAALTAAAGGVLVLGLGVYWLNATLSYSGTAPVAIIGQGMESSSGGVTKIKVAAGASLTQIGTTGFNAVISVANPSNVNHFRFDNFYVDMSGLTNTVGLYCDQVGYSTFDNLKFREGAIGLATLRVAGSNLRNLHAWNQAIYGFAFLYTDGPGGTSPGTVSVTTSGQGNSWTDCEYRQTAAVNECTAGYAILSGQQDIAFTNCHATRSIGIAKGTQYGFLIQGPVSTWPPDATWAGQVHMIQCNADGIANAAGNGAGYAFINYRHVRRSQSWDSAMDTVNAWYAPAMIIDNCQDVVINASEISSNGILLRNNVDLCTLSSNHFLNAGTNTTCVTIGTAALTNLVFDVNNKKVAAALWFDQQQLAANAMNSASQIDRNASGLITQAYNKLWLRSGAKGENIPRMTALGNQGLLSTGRLSMYLLPLLGYEPLSNLTFYSNATALATGAHYWFALYDISRNLIRQSTDQLAAAWNANTAVTLALDSLPATAGSRAGGTAVTLTFPANLSTQSPLTSVIATGDSITVSNASIAAYNGTFTVTGVTATTVTYNAGSSATDSLVAPFPTVQLAASKRAFVPSQPTLYYAGVMVAATTVPTITGATSQTAVAGVAPFLSGTADTGLTGTAPSPAAALSAQGAIAYVDWS